MKDQIKRVTLDIAGYSFIVVGAMAIPTPIVSGIPIVLVGMYLLSLHSKWFHRVLRRWGRRFPQFIGIIDAADGKVRKFLNIPL